jgi:hypothetical protein
VVIGGNSVQLHFIKICLANLAVIFKFELTMYMNSGFAILFQWLPADNPVQFLMVVSPEVILPMRAKSNTRATKSIT